MAIPAIVNYIVSELERGTPKEEIGKALALHGGWRPRDIEASFRSIGVTPPALPLAAKVWDRFRTTVGGIALVFAAMLIIGSLAWYGVVLLRTPDYIVNRALTNALFARSVSSVAVIRAEMTAPSRAFDSFFGARESAAREIVNGTLRVSGSFDLSTPDHLQAAGSIRLDAKSSRFSTDTPLQGEVSYVYDAPLFYASMPRAVAAVLLPETGDQPETVASFDLSRTSLPTRFLSPDERTKLIALWQEQTPLTLEDKGLFVRNGETVRRFSYVVNPLALKFILRDFSSAFPETLPPEKLQSLEKILDSIEFEEGDIIVSRYRYRLIEVSVDTAFVRGNPFAFGGTASALVTFGDYNEPVSVTVPEQSVLLRTEDIFP